MNDIDKTKERLIHEITSLRRRIHEMETVESENGHLKETLFEIEKSYHTLSENLPGIVYRKILGENKKILFYNNMLHALTGYDVEDLPAGDVCSFDALILPEEKAYFTAVVKEAIKAERPFHVEYRIRNKGGEIRYFLERGRPICGPDGNPSYIDGVILDITERKKAEEFIKNILESVDEGFIVIDREYRIISANTAFCAQVGMPLKKIIGKHCYTISHHSHKPCFEVGDECAVKRTYDTGDPCSTVHVHQDSADNPFYVETKSYPMKDTSGKIVSVIEIFNDITDKVVLENRLRHSQKMEAVGRLAGGVAHDFNNILTAVIGYGNILRMKTDKEAPSGVYIDKILASADRASTLIQGLLAFSRREKLHPRHVSLNGIIERIEHLLAGLIGEDIEIKTILSDQDLTITADSSQIEQVLMNLAANARDAMINGGRLTLQTERVELDDAFIRIHGYGSRGVYACLSVSDIGDGMDKNTKDKAFEPFFTTKEVGKGTGLGLSMVYGIIEQHKGHINVSSEPGKGSTFRIYLPLYTANVAETREKDIPPPARGTETVMIAEDEAEVRKLIKKTFEEFGYTVIEAINGDDAVKKFKDNEDSIRLVLLDVVMPGKNGKKAYEEIKEIRPDIKAIFTGGYTTETMREKGFIEEGLNFIPKPAAPDELLKKARELLDQRTV